MENRTLSKKAIRSIVDAIQDIPGWLRTLEMPLGGAVGAYAESYHDSEMEAVHRAKKHYLSVERPKVRKLVEEFILENKVFSEEVMKRRMDEQRLELSEKTELLEKLMEESGSIEKKEQLLKDITRIDKVLRQDITQDMIDAADRYPIERLVDMDSRMFALCIWHDDTKPSMYCKNNFCHCFTCGKTGGAISVLMQKEKINFREAVLKLQQ